MIEFIKALITPQVEETIIVFAFSLVAYLITSNLVVFLISHLFKKTTTVLDDVLIEKGLLHRISYLVPLIILYNYNVSQSELTYFWIIDRMNRTYPKKIWCNIFSILKWVFFNVYIIVYYLS